MTTNEDMTEMLAAVDRGFLAVKAHIAAHWPQHEAKGDIHETNLVFHVGAAFRDAGCLVYVEVPHAGGTKNRCDLLVLCPDRGWALAAEFKNVTHQGMDADFADDARRLRGLRLLATTGTVERLLLRCYVSLAIGTWTPATRAWWEARGGRGPAPEGATRPEEWADVGSFLAASPSIQVTDIRVKAPHWGLVAVQPAPGGAFWR